MSPPDATALALAAPVANRALRSRYELEFLPAAVEILETPPSPAGRAIALTIAAFVAAALAWACIGKIDIVATAAGRIMPSGRVKIIQPVASGVVRIIAVEDGKHVKAGDLLVELDPTNATADVERLTRDLSAAEVDIARLRAILSGAAQFSAPKGSYLDLVATQQAQMRSQMQAQVDRLAALDHEIERQKAAADSAASDLAKISEAFPLLRERAEIYRILADKGLASKVTYLELAQQRVEMEHDLVGAKSKLAEAKAAMAEAERQRQGAIEDFASQRLAELSTAQQKAAGLAQDLVKAEKRQTWQRLTSPVDGTVQQLNLHTIGGVVESAQKLMIVVPDSDQLEIEAQVLNQDIGFVREGQSAVVKLDAFPFTLYGTISGRVVTVSRDASADQKGGLTYTARISLARTSMLADGQEVNLTPGMSGTVEIDTGQRRVIEYVLSPLIRAGGEKFLRKDNFRWELAARK